MGLREGNGRAPLYRDSPDSPPEDGLRNCLPGMGFWAVTTFTVFFWGCDVGNTARRSVGQFPRLRIGKSGFFQGGTAAARDGVNRRLRSGGQAFTPVRPALPQKTHFYHLLSVSVDCWDWHWKWQICCVKVKESWTVFGRSGSIQRIRCGYQFDKNDCTSLNYGTDPESSDHMDPDVCAWSVSKSLD